MSVRLDFDAFEREFKSSLMTTVKPYIQKMMANLRSYALELIGIELRASEEFKSLTEPNGLLRVEFGLADPVPMVESVITAIQAAMTIRELPPEGDSIGGLEIAAFADQFEDALSAHWASYDSHNSKGQSLPIPWLRWLLFETGVVLENHEIVKRRFPTHSRTQQALMISYDYSFMHPTMRVLYHRHKGRLGPKSNWSVPKEFAATADSNWLTIVAAKIQDRLVAKLQEEVDGL